MGQLGVHGPVLGDHPVDVERLDRTGRGGLQDVLALGLVRVGVVHERFLAVHREDVRRQEGALPVALTAREINDNSHSHPPPIWARDTPTGRSDTPLPVLLLGDKRGRAWIGYFRGQADLHRRRFRRSQSVGTEQAGQRFLVWAPGQPGADRRPVAVPGRRRALAPQFGERIRNLGISDLGKQAVTAWITSARPSDRNPSSDAVWRLIARFLTAPHRHTEPIAGPRPRPGSTAAHRRSPRPSAADPAQTAPA